ncbi:MAG: hypothetical protein R2695_05945 [Acidimicrobiales bacterium]
MCQTCTTVVDTAATNAVFIAAFAVNRGTRVLDRFRGRRRLDRDLATWEANARFMRSMGHDPLAVIGAPPAVPSTGPREAPVLATPPH